MVWAITIAVFLGIVVVALFIFFIYSQKEEIRKALKERRAEKRIPTEVEVELSTSPDEPILYEESLTENASRHGARIVSRKHRKPHDHVLVRLPQKTKPSRARVAYCTALASDAFAVGLHFSSAVDDWLISDSDISNGERSQLYRK
jgi:cytochrome c-type biogenesis protein CcmH/NrfG